MIRLSVTELDSYLYWRDEAEDMPLEELLARLRGEQPETVNMRAGKAFHKLFEHVGQGDLDTVTVDGFDFVFDIDQELCIPPVRELKGEVVFQTRSGPVTLVGKVDSLDGFVVNDWKLTERFDAERYVDSMQWRCYLTMFAARRFDYHVFVGRYDTKQPLITVREYHRLPVYAYPEMRADVQDAVSGLAEIVAKYVPQKVAA